MIHTTKWKPDTCKCEVEYEWDDSVETTLRAHTLKRISKCPFHEGLIKQTAYDSVLDENKTKNKVHGMLLEKFPELGEEKTNQGGDVVRQLKPGVNFNWSFDVDRNLEIRLEGVSPVQKTKLQEFVTGDTTLKKTTIL